MEKLSASLEKYIIAIYEILNEKIKLTPKNIGEKLGFNKASTLEGIKNLQAKGILEYFPYKEITLTENGKKYAKNLIKKQAVISNYFKNFLLLEGEDLIKAIDSVLFGANEILIDRIDFFNNFLDFCPINGERWLLGFREYLEKGEIPKLCSECLEEAIENNEKINCKICNR